MQSAIRWAVVALATLAVSQPSGGQSGPRVVLAQPGLGETGRIARFTMRFDQPMVPLGDPRAAAPATTPCAGNGRWADQQSWVFDFAEPLAGGTSCRFEAREDLASVSGQTLTGPRAFTADAGGPVARAVLPGGYGDAIEEDQVFLVAANGQPDRASVAANAYCAIDGVGERVPVNLLPPTVAGRLLSELGTDRWPTSRFVEEAGLPSALPASPEARSRVLSGVVALQCRRPLPPGRDVALVWGAGITGTGGRAAGTDQRFDYTVRQPFTARFECGRTNAGAGCSPVEKAWVRFTAPVPRGEAEKVRIVLPDGRAIAPVLSDDDKRRATVEQLGFAAPLPFDTTARVELPAGLKDESGRALANAERFPLDIRIDRAPPLVKFAAEFGILEAREGGVLPVTVRNVEPGLRGRVAGVDGRSLKVGDSDAEIARWLRRVDDADDDQVDEVRRGAETVRINRTGAASILAGGGSALAVPLPGKGRDFEVVGIPLKTPGFYVVELASPELGRALLGRVAPRYVATAALVTNMAVHFKWGRERSLAWVTALDTGKPVARAEVRITDSCTGRLLARGVTDRAGGLMVPPGLPQPETYGGCEGEGSPHPLMVSARAGGDFSFVLSGWGEGIRPYDFELPFGYSAADETIHTVFDRALVRQGEAVNMKHLLRRPVGSGFRVPPDLQGTLTLSHSGSGTEFTLPLAIRNGAGETRWQVPAGAPMGDYALRVTAGERTIYTGQSVRVDEYRLPTMRASVTGPKPVVVRPGKLPLDLFVGYLSGGGASNLPVDLRLGWSRRFRAPDGYERYSFGGAAPKEGVTPLDADGEESAAPLPPVQLLPATLGADGARRTTVEVPTLAEAADLRIEMDYRDANGEVLTASRTVGVLPSAVQIGVAGDGWLMKADDLRLRMVALDPDGKPIAGQKLSVALYSREVLTARRRLIGGFYAYDNRVRTTKLDGECSAKTDARGEARCAIDAGVSGEVHAVVTATDADGNVSRTVQSVWLQGDDDWWFGGDNGDRMDVVPERQSYAAGETARFQVRMPFRHATALVTVEREGVLRSFVTELSGTDPVIAVPMPGAYAPDVFVSVLAVRGRVESGFWSWLRGVGRSLGLSSGPPEAAPTALVDLAKPAYRLGMAKVKVGWEGHRLAVAVRADRDRYAPRETAQVAVQVRRPDGQPARSADVAFVAVDKALLQLAPNESWDVLTAMMGERPLSVLTATAQTQVVGKRHYGKKAVEAGGGGGDASALNRENFQPVLLWRGRLPLDAQGRARVAVPLSDALSSFKLVAVATEGAGLFGTGEADVRTAQDLSIFAGLPPLVREGDRFAAQFTLRNGSARDLTVTARVRLAPGIAVGRPLTVTIPAGRAAPVAWNLLVPPGLTGLSWQVSATSSDGRAADQMTATQAVVPAVPVETWAAALVRVGEQTALPIAPPAGALPGRGSVEVALTDSLAPSLAGARDYMSRYPYQCFEQRLSRIVVLGDVGGWQRLAAELPTYQAPDGLLRYFPSDSLQGSEALTAYVLSLTAAAGLPVPQANRQRMVDALVAVIDGRLRNESYGDVRLQRVAAFAALARVGAATPAMLGQLSVAPEAMPTATLADYLLALDRVPGLANAPALRRQGEAVLRSRLVYEGTRLDLSDQGQAAWWLMQSGDEAALKAVLATLGRPGWEAEAPRMMTGAALRQSRGHWDTTPANAWGAMAARAFARTYPAEAIGGTTTLQLGRASVSRSWPLAAEGRTVSMPLPARTAPLVLRQAGGAGPWATVNARAAVPLRQPLFAGYRLSRSVEVVQARNPGRLTRGDVLRVTLTVDAAAERNWVVISDPIPAGATVVSDLGGQSQLLAQGEAGSPSYVERGQEAWRGYFAWMPRGRTVSSYTLRLNGAGRFVLPPARVEAMYSPAIRAAVPLAPVEVADR